MKKLEINQSFISTVLILLCYVYLYFLITYLWQSLLVINEVWGTNWQDWAMVWNCIFLRENHKECGWGLLVVAFLTCEAVILLCSKLIPILTRYWRINMTTLCAFSNGLKEHLINICIYPPQMCLYQLIWLLRRPKRRFFLFTLPLQSYKISYWKRDS